VTASPTAQQITLLATEECNFACTYCYLSRSARRAMSLEVAQTAVDLFLSHRELFPAPQVTWDFLGGEPLLAAELIGQIIDHIERRARELRHPWAEGASYLITTNGALYGTPPVQRLVERCGHQLTVRFSLGGTESAHDQERIYPDGRGTYRDIVRNVDHWLSQCTRASARMILSPASLPHLAESVLHLLALGIPEIQVRPIFERLWQPGHDSLFEDQLDQLGEALISRELLDRRCSLFDRHIGQPIPRHENAPWCGAGKMIAVGPAGELYPCARFMEGALVKRGARILGDVSRGIDLNRLRPFRALTRLSQSPASCESCSVASGCGWCLALSYDDADTSTIFQRATHACLMHQARVRANHRFWARVDALG
jgi:uncharacterized protein